MEEVMAFIQHPLVQGPLNGLLAGVSVDYIAFRGWKNFNEAATYDWSTAAWRWFQGAVTGFAGAVGWAGLATLTT